MHKQLEHFLPVMQTRMDKEFLALPETFDRKYRHHVVIFYICSLEFPPETKESDLPEWYSKICAIAKGDGKPRYYVDVVKKMLQVLTSK